MSVHREYAVRCNEPEPGVGSSPKLRLEISHVGTCVAKPPGLAEPYAVYDRRVIERVRNNCILGSEDGLEQAGVCVEAAGIQDCVLEPKECREPCL